MAFGDHYVEPDYYLDDSLDYDYLSHTPYSLPEPVFESAPLDGESDEYEPDDFTGSSAFSLSAQAETILCRYLGDLYSVPGDASVTVNAESREADSSGGRPSVRSRLFADASLDRNPAGINLPPILATEFNHLDSLERSLAVPNRATNAFRFSEDDQSRFFSTQKLDADTISFARSLKYPDANPLTSKDYRLRDKTWAFVSEASAFAARVAAFSTALVDLLIRADELGVSEEDRISIRALLLDFSALNFSQAARIKLHATKRRRHLALECLKLPTDFNNSAVDRIPRAGSDLFDGKFLEVVDSDLVMNKRAKDVAFRFRKRALPEQRSFRGGRASFFSGRRGSRSRTGRSRFQLSRGRGGYRSGSSSRSAPPP